MAEWIIPFAGRNHSHVVKLNFLWRENNIYIMDNHRAAMWCWQQHHAPAPSALLHVDRHYDALFSEKDWAAYRQIDAMSLDAAAYLDEGYDNDFFMVTPLFRWDNYLGLYLKEHGETLEKTVFATHGRGVCPENVLEVAPWDVGDALASHKGPWILNLDLDYFFFKDSDGERRLMFAEIWIRDFLKPMKQMVDDGRAACLTISLSPECSGGWAGAEAACEIVSDVFGLDFALPADK